MNPAIPFAGTILGGLSPGEMVLIQGSVPPTADRFQIDLACGSSVAPRADVAFHFNPRFNRSCIVCNSLQKERWGWEEIHHVMPFSPASDFELLILVQSDSFKVAVNGAHVLQYKHRLDLDRVDTLFIHGNVRVQAVGVLPGQSPVCSEAEMSVCATEPNPIVSSSGDMSVPFRGELVPGLGVGRSITVKGLTNHNAQSLCVNLRVKNSTDIALHLNPRLNKNVFVRNSFLSDRWGPEETRVSAFPFATGQYFEMIVLCEAHQFRVAVNGVHQLDYKHRVQDLSTIGQVEVLGDLTLEDVRLL